MMLHEICRHFGDKLFRRTRENLQLNSVFLIYSRLLVKNRKIQSLRNRFINIVRNRWFDTHLETLNKFEIEPLVTRRRGPAGNRTI